MSTVDSNASILERDALIDLCVFRVHVRRRRPLGVADNEPVEYDERWTWRVGNIAGTYYQSKAEATAGVRELIRGAVEVLNQGA